MPLAITPPRENRSLLNTLKKLFFWNYPRNTWQWDALCVAILIFIFLTPKSAFQNSERRGASLHQTSTATILLVDAQVIETAADKGQLEQRIRGLTGRQDIQVLNVRKLTDEQGKTRGYEVDIR
ncbi:MAG: hypothetical protein M3539_13355 [Acidobacteriota bacterium]|nr:hypothetical protein [Acidobacteriota bacterium]